MKARLEAIGRSSDNGALCPGQTGDAPPEKRLSRRLHRHIMNVIVRPASFGFSEAMLSLIASCNRVNANKDSLARNRGCARPRAPARYLSDSGSPSGGHGIT